ncbi:hypothetical protein [Phaeodactylibacter sp.]|uniref:hypothetical protein n=1 Tax=Phaeodactylibacter sp. TaxID=1940289 RepID=UPI0025FAA19D|nr:hypothetical protein [Phaeodactylibacter sp.]MCI4650828.1 hypothetical protein [Phaeodactylibacter sp.]MCI5089785.1 hypothetical protein [Phaeodactylibacter sp.]
MISQLKDMLADIIFCRYRPDRHTLPDRQTKTRTRTSGQGQADINLAEYTWTGGQLWVPDNEFKDNQADAAWKVDSVRSRTTDKVKELTPADIEELNARKLDHRKAIRIKPFWSQGLTTPEISRALGRVNGEKVRGYGETTVSLYCAAFSAALSGGGVDP